jgi:hypothetical protein
MIKWKFKRRSTEEKIHRNIKKAWDRLMRTQPDLFHFTSQTIPTEWNVAHHFAGQIHRLYTKYNCDFELIKPTEHRKRPDIVLHKRGTHAQNFLVIELKVHIDDMEDDVQKIKTYWFDYPLNYQYGVVFAYRPHLKITLLKNE